MRGEVELLRSVIIALAAVNSFTIARLEGGLSCCGSRRYYTAVYTALSGCVIFTLSVTLTAAAKQYLLERIAVGYAQNLVLVLCVSFFLFLLLPVSRMLGFEKYHSFIFIDSILLGTLLAQTEVTGIGKTALQAVLYGVYFVPAMVLFSRIRTRIDESETSPCFAGLPVMLLSGAFLSLALSGIVGIAEKLFT